MIISLKKNKTYWEVIGETDPLWGILTRSEKRGNKWQIDEFFETGIKEISKIIKYIDSLKIILPYKKALDFGCGVGRLTQALCRYFQEVDGVDISSSMIHLANKYNRYTKKCEYYENKTDDLKIFPNENYDFIYSNITLQHIPPIYSKKYIKEFLRVLKPDGLLIFQLPSEHSSNWRARVHFVMNRIIEIKKKAFNQPYEKMYGIKKNDVVAFLECIGGIVVDVFENTAAGPNWISYQYCVRKHEA